MKIDQMMNELEKIVQRLEQEDLSFDEAVDLYNKGIEIYKKLLLMLNETKIQIQDVYARTQQFVEGTDIES
ncbi:MAG: exodeoxyribonuclease VII small subunit [Pseudothermotoga sp.]